MKADASKALGDAKKEASALLGKDKAIMKNEEMMIMKFLRPYHKFFGLVWVLIGAFLLLKGNKYM